MPEHTQQSYKEEHDVLQDDTLKVPALRPLSAPLATLPKGSAKTAHEQELVIDEDEDHETGLQTTMKRPAQTKPLAPDGQGKGSFSEQNADKVDMTQEQEQPTFTVQEQTPEPDTDERAEIIATVAEVISATVNYAVAELATIILHKVQAMQDAQDAQSTSADQPSVETAFEQETDASMLTTAHQEAQEIATSETFVTSETSVTSETHDIILALQERIAAILNTPRPQEIAIPEQKMLPTTPAMVDQAIPITPMPREGATADQSHTGTGSMVRPQRSSLRRWMLSAVCFMLLITSIALLWRDLAATHLLLTTLDPRTGMLSSQQDVANYQDKPSLTTSVDRSSSIVVALHNDTTTNPAGTQHLIVFHAHNGQWTQQTQFSAPLTHGSVQLSPAGQVLVNTAQAIQVHTADGQLLWTAPSDQPTRGVHRFQAVSNTHLLYTIKSLAQSQVVAYDVHNGQTNWVQTLDDSLNFTPPFLLSESMLYIASDHYIYALNNNDGTLRWQQPYPSRTLLLVHKGQSTLLIAAGTQGLVALDANTGRTVWTFKGQVSDTLTAPELYQATTDSSNTSTALIYTTGIVWIMPQIQEQVWLYAVDARTGSQVWAKRVGDSFISADAGRILSPQLDTTHHLVLLQQQISADSQQIAAFNANNGSTRWLTTLTNTTPATASLFATSDGTLLLIRTLSNNSDLLWIASPWRLLLLASMLLNLAILYFLWLHSWYTMFTRIFLPVESSLQSEQNSPKRHFKQQPATTKDNKTGRLRVWVNTLLLLACIATGVLSYVRLNQPQENVYQLSAQNGAIGWQHTIAQPAHPLLANAHGSIIVSNDSPDSPLSRLQALNASGDISWQTFASEGTFATPIAPIPSSQVGTILVTLSGSATRPYQFAPDDTAYQHPIDHTLSLYLFDQGNGNIIWQRVVLPPTAQQQGIVLGADSNDLYIASTPLTTTQPSSGQASQLIAINRQTGVVDWRVFGSTRAPSALTPDTGSLLIAHGVAIWQVNGIIYAIDSAVGQIIWRHPLQSDTATVLLQEEQQMLATPKALLVTRLDGIQALDLVSGNELWHIAELGIAMFPAKAGFALAGNILLVYGDGQVEAFDTQSHQNLWSQKQLGYIEHLRVSDDGSWLYLLHTSTPSGTPSIIALNTQTGATRWSFTLPGPIPASTNGTDSFFYNHGVLFAVSCTTTTTTACQKQYLYALNGLTGDIAWKLTGIPISSIHISQDGSTLIAQTSSSIWENVFSHIQG